MKREGFLLIETLIYLIISTIFFILLFQFLSNTYTKYRKCCFSNSHYTNAHSALYLIERDIQKSSNNPLLWKKLQNNCLIFSISSNNKTLDIRWVTEKNNLYRIEGEYDKQLNSWKNSIKSLVLTKIINLEVAFNKTFYLNNESIQSNIISLLNIIIELKIENKKIKFQKSIIPRTGFLNL